MANVKNITELPVAESADGLNLIVNDNGSAKQIAASAVGAQADWAETDETSPAFVKNKPVEEWDLDVTVNATPGDGETNYTPVVNTGVFDVIKNKLLNNEHVKTNLYIVAANPSDPSMVISENDTVLGILYVPHDAFDGNPELIQFGFNSTFNGMRFIGCFYSDGSIEVFPE